MSQNPLAELLGRRLGDGTGTGSLTIVLLHRGLPGNTRDVPGSAVVRVRRAALVLDDGSEIPLRRVLVVRDGSRELWRRASSAGDRNPR